MGSFDFAQYQLDVCTEFAQVCREDVAVDPLLVRLAQFAGQAEDLIAQDPGDRSLIDCGPGCSSCCVVNVSTLMPEGFAIVRYICQQGDKWTKRVTERLEALWRDVRGLDDDDRLFVRRPCAFLDDAGRCSIYPVRPLLCRSVTSTSALSCREALANKLLGNEDGVLMNQFQQSLYEALFSGVAAGVEDCGLDGRSFQLTGLIRYLLKSPAAGLEWFQGRQLNWQDLY